MRKALMLALIGVSVTVVAEEALAVLFPIDIRLRKVSAVEFSDFNGQLVSTSIKLAPRPLRVQTEIDLSTVNLNGLPTTYRNPVDTASITSSFARYAGPLLGTPHTADLLELFGGSAPTSDVRQAEVSIAWFDYDNVPDASFGTISIGRTMTLSRPEGEFTRVIEYIQAFTIQAQNYLVGGQEVPAIDFAAFERIFLERDLSEFTELGLSYLERLCGRPEGCERTDAVGFWYKWAEVRHTAPEPSGFVLAVLGLVAAWIAKLGVTSSVRVR